MTDRVYVAGSTGLVGSALTRAFERVGATLVHSRDHVDLRDQRAAAEAIATAKPDVLVLVAGRVGGIAANLADPVGFLEDNLRIELNVIRAAFDAGVQRLLFIGSANAYPHDAPQPIREDALGSGTIDAGTSSYGLSKLVGVQLCNAFREQHGVVYHSIMPCNLYGIGDRFDPATAHVVAATLRRFHDAQVRGDSFVEVWGSGEQRRQLLFADDLAEACLLLLGLNDPPMHVNVGPHGDTPIRDLAHLASEIVGFDGEIRFDRSRPEGVMRRELDTSLMHGLGWTNRTSLAEGMRRSWDWYQSRTRTDIKELNS